MRPSNLSSRTRITGTSRTRLLATLPFLTALAISACGSASSSTAAARADSGVVPAGDAWAGDGSDGSDAAGESAVDDATSGAPMWSSESVPAGRPLTTVTTKVAAVYTQHNDVARTGANLLERTLDTSNVNKDTFGLVFSRDVVGQIYAQPLYALGVSIPDRGVHDLVVVATEHDDVYAFDASDPAAATPIWHVHVAEPVPTTELLSVGYCGDLAPEVGITATPVIDPGRGVVYVEAKEKRAGGYVHHLYALDLATGAERIAPVEISADVAGTGDGSSADVVTFDPLKQNARAALLLTHGVIWIAYAGHCDAPPYHGWVFAYDAATLSQLGVFNDSPDTYAGGIWMAGQGLAADETGDTYFISGNAPYDTESAQPSYGDTLGRLHLSGDGVSIVDWFTPFNQSTLGSYDLDLGSAGAMLVPGTNWVVSAGKQGKLYVVDRANMGTNRADDDSQIVQSFQATNADPEWGHALYGAPVFWNGHIYLWGASDDLRAFSLSTDRFDTTPQAISTVDRPPMPGGILSVSADGAAIGSSIVWASVPKSDAGRSTAEGVLRAFDASDVSHELWNSDQIAGRDAVGTFAKFTPPTVANGRVYLATFGSKLRVYGLLSSE